MRCKGLAVLVVACGTALAVAGTVEGPPDGAWRDGPVRYLLSRDEYDRYGHLKTREAREAFVGRFWKRLDPIPSTPANEARERFEAHCVGANERFQENIVPGWRTDRGRILILLGEPDSIRRDAGEARGRDREIWTFNRPPGGQASPLEVYFYRGSTGRFTLRPEDLHAAAPSLGAAAERERRTLVRRQLREDNPWLNEFDLDRLVEVLASPSPNGTIDAETDAERDARRRSQGTVFRGGPPAAPIRDLTMDEAAYFFESADGSVLVLLALDYRDPPPDDGAAISDARPAATDAVAWISEKGGGADRLGLEVRLDRIPREKGALFVGKAHLEPGTYGVRLAVADEPSRSLFLRSFDLEVPELGTGRLAASSVVPADRFGPTPPGGTSPFSVGSEEVWPRPDGVFRKGEPLRLYLQVYGAAPDPYSGKPQVDVRFRFERSTRGGFRLHGRPLSVRGAQGASMGLALPVGDWPTGEYRVLVELHDRVSGDRATTEGRFRIAD